MFNPRLLNQIFFLFSLLYVFISPAYGSAQEEEGLTLQKIETPPSEEKVLGWKPTLSLSSNLSFGSNSDVIGQQDGDTLTLGANLQGAMNYRDLLREWRNSLKIASAATRTPSIPRYVKSTDELSFVSLYLHSLKNYPWLGPYIRASLDTSIFKGEDVRESVTDYRITNLDGSQETRAGRTLRLTDPFRPMTTRESVGFFAKIIEKEKMNLETRLGFGALQVMATDQYTVADDPATIEIDVRELDNYEQAGIEGGLLFKGSIDEKTLYSLNMDFLIPVIKDLPAGDDREALELTNYEVAAKLTSKVYSWVNIDYEYKIKKQPQLLDKNQIQHLLLLNFSYTLL